MEKNTSLLIASVGYAKMDTPDLLCEVYHTRH